MNFDSDTRGDSEMTPECFSVWVGGVEVNDYLVTFDQALEIAEEWREDGYEDVAIDDYRLPSETLE